MREQELIVYRDFENGELLSDMIYLIENYRASKGEGKEKFRT